MFLKLLKFLLLMSVTGTAMGQPLNIVATINPLGLMAKSIAGDLATVDVMLQGGQSPHDYVMSMSDRKQINRADLILWVGPTLEPYMESLAAEKAVAMEHVVSSAEEETKVGHQHEAIGSHESGHHHEDGHLWLNPDAGASMMLSIAQYLAEVDPVHGAIYFERARQVNQELSELKAWPKGVPADRQYIVAHDAYGGFIEALGYPLPLVASGGAELGPSVRSLWQLGEQVQAGECLLVDVNHKRKWITGFAEKHRLRLVEVDIMGVGDAIVTYPQLLQQLQMKIDSCLNRTRAESSFSGDPAQVSGF